MLTTLFLAMTPVGELRAAIPVGIVTHDLAWWQAYLLAVLGNMVPPLVLLWVLDPVNRWLTSFDNPAGRFLTWRMGRLRERQGRAFERWGALALVPFIAVPLPITGAWTGSLAAWGFGLDRRRALAAIFAGVLIAGAVVTLIVELSIDFPFVHE